MFISILRTYIAIDVFQQQYLNPSDISILLPVLVIQFCFFFIFQNAVQRYQSSFNYVQTLMNSIIPLFAVLFLGPLSDMHGRKPPMIGVLIGFISLSLVYLAVAIFKTLPAEVMYLGTLLVSLSGTWVVFNMSVYSYVADITSPETRTKRMGFADAIWYLGSPMGTFLGGYIYKYGGYVGVYSTSAFIWTLSLLYLIIFVKESRPKTEIPQKCNVLTNLKGLFSVILKKRKNFGRPIILTLLCLKLGTFLVQGHQKLLWARKVLQWDVFQFSMWTGFEDASHQGGMVAWLAIAEKFNLHNCIISVVGIFSIMLWSITLACISGPTIWWLVIVATILGLLEASIEPPIRSMMTIIVGAGEEGRILAVSGMLESVWLSVDRLIYTVLYQLMLDYFPQIIYVVQATFCIPMIITFFILYKIMIRQQFEEPNLKYSDEDLDKQK